MPNFFCPKICGIKLDHHLQKKLQIQRKIEYIWNTAINLASGSGNKLNMLVSHSYWSWSASLVKIQCSFTAMNSRNPTNCEMKKRVFVLINGFDPWLTFRSGNPWRVGSQNRLETTCNHKLWAPDSSKKTPSPIEKTPFTDGFHEFASSPNQSLKFILYSTSAANWPRHPCRRVWYPLSTGAAWDDGLPRSGSQVAISFRLCLGLD